MIRTTSIAALCMTAAVAFAQDAPSTSPPNESERMERMAVLLDLDAGQKVAVQKILAEQRQEMQAQRKQAKESGQRPDREQMKEKIDAQRAATLEKLRPVLSDVQLKKFEALTDRPSGPMPGQQGKRQDRGQ